jgi:glycosyltransferase involved in cell wall biosynthesis
MSPATPELSIVIPAYNEEQRLPETLRRVRAYLDARGTSGEVIVVDDGSRDRTAALVEARRADFPALRLLSNGRNRGKGYSVRHGMLEARGRVVLFTDADLSAPIEEADKLLAALACGERSRTSTYDVAIGSRAVDRTLIEVHQSALREFAGIVFNWVVRLVTGLEFVDTQCGFKVFVRESARILFEQQRIEGFGFDPEILFLAKRHGLRAVEIPVRWAHHPATKVHVVRDGLRMFGEVFLIRWNCLRGRYPKSSAPSVRG